MSLDPFDNNDISPEWGDLDMDWLDLEKKPEPTPAPEPEPVPEPEVKQAPTRPQRPAAKPEFDWDAPSPRAPRPAPQTSSPEPRKKPEPKAVPAQRRPSRPVEVMSETEPAYLREKRSRRGGMNTPTLILIIVLIGGMIFAGWQLFSIFRNYHRDSTAYEELAARAISGMAEAEATARPDSTASPDETGEPAVSEVPFQLDWDYLESVNPEIIGWLYCPDTVIDYPVLQTSNNEFYLNHGANGASNTAGALFADVGVVAGITQSNFIVYGHNMKDNSMFGTYKNYVNTDYYDEHPVMYYLTKTQCYRIELMCCRLVDADLDNFPTYFSSADEYQSYLNKITSDAYWVNYSAVSTDYQLITMSTCTSGDNNRLLVQGIMIPIQ